LLAVASTAWPEEPARVAAASDALDVFDFEEAARRSLPPAHWGYLATGVDEDRTVRANREAFDKLQIRARHLVDVNRVDTSVAAMGLSLDAPIFLDPVSSLKAFHPEGELAVARAARTTRTLQVVSTLTTSPLEQIVAARGEPVWFQLYPTTDASVMRALVKKAGAASCPALVLTVDLPVGPNRHTQERLARLDSRQCSACHDGTFAGYLKRKAMFDGLDVSRVEDVVDTAMSWDVVKRLRDLTPMKLVLKGIVAREDAELALEHGVDAIIVSNHGGRSEESGRATLDCLPEVVGAVAGRLPVLVDSGFRRGTDILKALALGARAVGIGRPYVWGLAAFGEEGTEAVLRMLRAELVLAMKTCGTPSVAGITRDALVTAR
jgi:4-hydroxymandelate oxidase